MYVSDRIPHAVADALPEKILFRIPKIKENKDISLANNNGFEGNFESNIKSFFNDLDANLESIGFKSYGVSIPFLEYVFLNISAENNFNPKNAKNKVNIFKNKKIENYSFFKI